MTPGQEEAHEQLRALAAHRSGALDLLGDNPSKDGRSWLFDISIPCAGYQRREGGLPLRGQEDFRLVVGPDFPFEAPKVWVLHQRFAGYGHVQWSRSLCLYLSEEAEWDPRAGMRGLLKRLDLFLNRGARDEFEPVGAPLHPPVAYPTGGPGSLVVVHPDAPEVPDGGWVGLAKLENATEHRIDLVQWDDLATTVESPVAAAILLRDPLPFEYPTVVRDLLDVLADCAVPWPRLLRVLQVVARMNPEGTPLYIVLGTPMRGLRGGALKQHIAVWRIDTVPADSLRLTGIDDVHLREALQESIERLVTAIRDWAQSASIAWCRVLENRREVTVRRDHASPMAWFRGKKVELWGCGALGSHVAFALARAQVQTLVLRDKGIVTPGIIVRQAYRDVDVGVSKVEALAAQLRELHPQSEVFIQPCKSDIREDLDQEGLFEQMDLVIDATASNCVAEKLEARLLAFHAMIGACPVTSLIIDRDAQRGLATLSSPGYTGGVLDVRRRSKLAFCGKPELSDYADAFWPREPEQPFQPEPGCSSPTFVGSAADVMGLSALMLNCIASELIAGVSGGAVASGVRLPHVQGDPRTCNTRHIFSADVVFHDPESGFEIRVAPDAIEAIMNEISKSRAALGPRVETGGVLFGEYDDAVRAIWVTVATGPPSDSRQSRDLFDLGVEKVREKHDRYAMTSRGSTAYVGTWHTHPKKRPTPSSKDLGTIARLLEDGPPSGRQLMLILGGNLYSPDVCAMVFDRNHVSRWVQDEWKRRCKVEKLSVNGRRNKP